MPVRPRAVLESAAPAPRCPAPVRSDHLDVHVAHGDKIAHPAVPPRLHGCGPLPGDLAAALLGHGLLQGRVPRLVDTASARCPSAPSSSPSPGRCSAGFRSGRAWTAADHAVGAAHFRLKGGEEQQFLPGQPRSCPSPPLSHRVNSSGDLLSGISTSAGLPHSTAAIPAPPVRDDLPPPGRR